MGWWGEGGEGGTILYHGLCWLLSRSACPLPSFSPSALWDFLTAVPPPLSLTLQSFLLHFLPFCCLLAFVELYFAVPTHVDILAPHPLPVLEPAVQTDVSHTLPVFTHTSL